MLVDLTLQIILKPTPRGLETRADKGLRADNLRAERASTYWNGEVKTEFMVVGTAVPVYSIKSLSL